MSPAALASPLILTSKRERTVFTSSLAILVVQGDPFLPLRPVSKPQLEREGVNRFKSRAFCFRVFFFLSRGSVSLFYCLVSFPGAFKLSYRVHSALWEGLC